MDDETLHEDGGASETAGGKPGNGEPDEYEAQTEETSELAEEQPIDDADAVTSHGAGFSPSGHGTVADDEEALLDASEHDGANLPSGTDFPAADPPVSGKPIGQGSTISDPEPVTDDAEDLDDDY